jgi:hypothetical protein
LKISISKEDKNVNFVSGLPLPCNGSQAPPIPPRPILSPDTREFLQPLVNFFASGDADITGPIYFVMDPHWDPSQDDVTMFITSSPFGMSEQGFHFEYI